MPRILLGLGSNIDPEDHLNAAAVMLRERWPDIRFSSVYRSQPWGMEDQPDFLNAVGLMDAVQSVHEVFDFLRAIEEKRNKSVAVRFGPRTLDLDLLLYGSDILPDKDEWHRRNEQAATSNYQLILPHPRMHERRFVLEPLLELLDPADMHPVLQKSWKELLAQTENQEVQRMPMQL